VTTKELRELLETAGFQVRSLEVKTFTDVFESPEQVLEFNASSSFGNFFKILGTQAAIDWQREIIDELESLRTADGIPLERHTIFAVAEKPRANRRGPRGRAKQHDEPRA
jgi:hypothetical protein